MKITENNKNLKEFCANIDTDSTLSVDLDELNTFFNEHINE